MTVPRVPEELEPTVEDAVEHTLSVCKAGAWPFEKGGFNLTDMVGSYISSMAGEQIEHSEVLRRMPEFGHAFYDAAWELCRRGILRPWDKSAGSVRQSGQDGIADYLLTSLGASFVQDLDPSAIQPIYPNRLSLALAEQDELFGNAYAQRSQEAVLCYRAMAYLGCCAMCGAAAESIALSLAFASSSDEDSVLNEYLSSGGRRKLINRLVGQKSERLRRELEGHMGLLAYWRDAAAHGDRQDISETEAYLTLVQLYRFVLFASASWQNLTE